MGNSEGREKSHQTARGRGPETIAIQISHVFPSPHKCQVSCEITFFALFQNCAQRSTCLSSKETPMNIQHLCTEKRAAA